MKLTTSNASKAKPFPGGAGQRVTFTTRNGNLHFVYLQSGNSFQRNRHQLLTNAVHACRMEQWERFGRGNVVHSFVAQDMLRMFADLKARLLIEHGRREVGHV